MTDSKELIDRLRGKYALGPRGADGEPEFGYRQFDIFLPPIQEEAAAHIAALEARIEALEAEMKRRDENETRNCLNWGPCSRHDSRMADSV